MSFQPQIDYAKVFKLLAAVVVLIFCGSIFLHKYGTFLFNTSYLDFKIWYPKYHLYVYAGVRFLTFLTGVLLIYIAWLFKQYFNETLKALNFFSTQFKQESFAGWHSAEFVRPKYARKFFIFQFCSLIVAILLYYLIQFSGINEDGFQLQLLLSRIYILTALLVSLVFFIYNTIWTTGKLKEFFFTPASPYNLAVYRIVFFSLLAINYVSYARSKIIYIESKPRESLPFIGWFIDILPVTKQLYLYACIAGIVCCTFIVIGLRTRIFLFINAVLVFYIIATPNFYGKIWHSQLPIWISWYLMFAPVADVFSLDRRFYNKDQPLYQSPGFTFPVRIIWLQLGFVYFWAGFYKLWDGGFEWALGDSMINQVRLEWFEHFDEIPVLRVDNYPVLLYVGGIAVIFFELTFFLWLFHKRWKYLSIAGGLLMHNIIGAFMYIRFKPLQWQYIVFINFEKVIRWLKKLIPSLPYQPVITQLQTGISKKMLVFSLFIFGMNFIFGMFCISSFPFSVYPTYSEIVESEKEYLHYTIIDKELKDVDVWEMGKENEFIWENFTRLEYAIIKNYRSKNKLDSTAIYNQWRWWTNEIDSLNFADTVDVYIYKRSLNPDSAKLFLNKDFLIRIYPQNNLTARKTAN